MTVMRESYAWGAEYCFSVTGECGSVDAFCEEELTACLQPQIAGRPDARQRVEGAARRLKELGEKAESHGGTHMGAVWILPVMGGKGWNRE